MSRLTDKLKKLGKDAVEVGEALVEEGENLAKKGKELAYKGVAKIEKDLANRTGVIGGLATIVEDVYNEGRKFHESVKDQGGYGAVANKYVERFAEATVKAHDTIYDKFAAEDGTLDTAKLKKEFKSVADVVKTYGIKAGNTMWDLAKQGAQTIKTEYRNMAPTKEELQGKYAGIGTMYRGVLFRPHYEATLKFYEEARQKLPNGLKKEDRIGILDDIKATASGNTEELKRWYIENLSIGDSKMKIINKYLV
jgi:hypothetical protein